MDRTPEWLKSIVPKLPVRKPYQTAFKPISPGKSSLSNYLPKTVNKTTTGLFPSNESKTSKPSMLSSIAPTNAAGVVAGGEYVVGKQATNMIGAQNLDRMQENVLGRPIVRGGQTIPGTLPNYGAMDDGGLVNAGMEQSVRLRSLANWQQAAGIMGAKNTTGHELMRGPDLSNLKPITYQVPNAPANPVLPTRSITGSTATTTPPVGLGGTTTPPVGLGGTTTPPVGLGAKYQGMAIGRLADISAGQSPLYKAMTNRLMQEEALRNAAAQGEQRQSIAQRGLKGTGIASAEATAQRIQQGSETAGLAAKTAEAQMGQMAGATTALAGAANTIAAQDYVKQVDAMTTALKSGDINSFASMAKNLYGMNVDTTQLKNQQNMDNFSTGMTGLNSLALQDPNFNVNTPGASMYLQSIWNSQHPGQPMDAKWASDTASNIKNASNPFYRAMNAVDEPTADLIWGKDAIANMGGYNSFRQNMAKFFASGGISFDANGNWTTTGLGDKSNPIASLLNSSVQVAPPTSVLNQMGQGTVNKTFTDGSTTWLQTAWNSTTNKPTYTTITRSSAGITQTSDGVWQYNGTDITNPVTGNKINSYDAATKIGKDNTGAAAIVGDDGKITAVSSLTNEQLANLQPAQITALMGQKKVKDYVVGQVLSGDYTYANDNTVKSEVAKLATQPHTTTTITGTNHVFNGIAFDDIIGNPNPSGIVINVNGKLYKVTSQTATYASSNDSHNFTIYVTDLSDGTNTSFIGNTKQGNAIGEQTS